MSHSLPDRGDDIVIIDDDLLTLEFAKRSLRGTAVKLSCFSDALNALAYLQQHTPRVLLVDHRMPCLDGLELLQQLADSNAELATSTFLCSDAALPGNLCAKAAELGAKPMLKDALRSKTDFLELLESA